MQLISFQLWSNVITAFLRHIRQESWDQHAIHFYTKQPLV